MKRSVPRRSGMILVCVIVALVIAVALSGLMIQSSLRARRQMQTEWQLEQTRMLLDVGIRTAMSQPKRSKQVNVLDDALPRYSSGRISIELLDEPAIDNKVAYRVTAMIESRGQLPVVTRRSRTVLISAADDASTNAIQESEPAEAAPPTAVNRPTIQSIPTEGK